MHEVVKTTPFHIISVAYNLRPSEKRELEHAGSDPPIAIKYAFDHAPFCRTWLADDEAACILGIGITASNKALPFIYATPLLEKHKLTFIKGYRKILADVLSTYPVIEGVIEAERRPYLRWLRALGFTIEPARYIAAVNGTFCRFEMRAN